MGRTAQALAFLLALGAGPAVAVPQGVASATAEFVCEYRAISAQHPDPGLRGPDTLAAKLCKPSLLPDTYAEARQAIDAQPETFSAYYFVNARTRHIDEQLTKAAADGITQVVVLGAGFDSRAYRFHAAYPKLRFFEVDLPATLQLKQRRVARVLGALPKHVRYVPIDFNTQTLDHVLRRAGYDPSKKTFFILEGVVMYVNDAGNRATFRFVRQSAPGSRMVYDYVLRQVVEGAYDGLYGARASAQGVAKMGEPYVTGWTPAEAAAFARENGLEVVEDLGWEEQTRRYLTGSDGKVDGRMTDWQRVMGVRVP